MNKRRVTGLAALGLAIAVGVAWFLWSSGPSSDSVSTQSDAGQQANTTAPDTPHIAGKVVDSTGAPIPGATVETSSGSTASTDENGAFLLGELDPGTYQLDASADGYVAAGPTEMRQVSVTLSSERETPAVRNLELVLRRPATLRGRVVADGQGISDANLGLYYLFADGLTDPLDPFSLDAVGATSKDGSFELDSVAPGRLHILAEGGEHGLAESRELYLEPGETREGITIDLAPSGTIVGSAFDQDGNPIEADIVLRGGSLARSRRVTSEADGSYVFRRVPPGTYVLRARADGHLSETFSDIEVDSKKPTRLDIVLESGSGIYGRVITPDGSEAPGAIVEFRTDARVVERVRADETGHFQWPKPPEQTYLAVAISPQHASSSTTSVRRGEEAVLELGRGGSVSGRVVGPRGQPVQSFSIGVETADVDGSRPYRSRSAGVETVNDSAGRFEFESLRPGTYRFRARASTHGSATSDEVTVTAGGHSSDVLIQVGRSGKVSGRVTDAKTGQPLERARVVLYDPASPFSPKQTRTDDSGQYELSGIPPGRRSIRVSKNNYLTSVSAGIDVSADTETTRDVELRKQKPGERMSFHGIGAVLTQTEEGTQVRQVMEGHPAAEYGLEKGDIIEAVDGQSVDGMRLHQVIEQIRGQQGAPVELEIKRQGQGHLRLEMERGQVVVKQRRGR